eukprot:gene6296-2928_t
MIVAFTHCTNSYQITTQWIFAFTHMNAHSSRSHTVVMLTVVKSRKHLTNAEKVKARKAREKMELAHPKSPQWQAVSRRPGRNSEVLEESKKVRRREGSEAISLNLSS